MSELCGRVTSCAGFDFKVRDIESLVVGEPDPLVPVFARNFTAVGFAEYGKSPQAIIL